MALVSPGVEVTIVDESAFPAASTATVPFILVATAANKINGAGTAVAPGTLASAVGNTFLISSQRELTNTFGTPAFYKTSSGTPIHGYELNEYGLQAAYSVLGLSNRAYVQRADIDLAELTPTTVRPSGNPENGTYWLDTASTQWGIFEWNETTEAFKNKVPTVITSLSNLVGGVVTGEPLPSIGNIGDYAVVAISVRTPIYYKNRSNTWVLVGDNTDTGIAADSDWYDSHPSVTSADASTLTLTSGTTIDINTSGNGGTVTLSGTTIATLVSDINTASLTGITAAVVSNKVEIYADATSSGAYPPATMLMPGVEYTILTVGTTDFTAIGAGANEVGKTFIATGMGTGTGTVRHHILAVTDNTGTGLSGTYGMLQLRQSTHANNPTWKASDLMITGGRRTGSVWIKTTSVDLGTNLAIKKFDSTTGTFVSQVTSLHCDDESAINALDPANGGSAIPPGTTYARFDSFTDDTATLMVLFRTQTGATEVAGAITNPTFTVGNTFTIKASDNSSTVLTAPVTVTLTGTTAASFVEDWLATGVANTTALVTTAGAVKIVHTQGGVIEVKDITGTPLADAGFSISQYNVRECVQGDLIITNFEALGMEAVFSAGPTQPGQDPVEGTKWYSSAIDEIDIMVQGGGGWKGYLTKFPTTDPAGPTVSVLAPSAQSDGTALVANDLWVDTSDLENFPLINRWSGTKWVAVDTTDQTSEKGILFADARWDTDGTTDPISGTMPTIASLLSSNYLDLDAPSPSLYPTGTLLWNLRRSGFNVKEFKLNYFNSTDFTGVIPTETNAWVTASGLKDNGEANMGRLAQRAIVVAAMKAAIDSNTEIREEQRVFNLLAAPGYPELMTNMVALNNERNNTGFVVGDTPLRLSESGTDLVNWSTNNNGLGLATNDGLNVNDQYLGVFYPSGRSTDLTGSAIVVPPSHALLRTIVHSDDQSYPWLAPAGTRRGSIDNLDALGYIDSATGEFQQTGTRNATRDTLYENNINPLTFIPGTGLVNYGNKTTQSGTALDRINVARLVSFIRQQVENAAKTFIFEPNDKLTRDEIKGVMESIMNDLIAKRGLFDYLVVCDESNNTPARIDRNELYVDIAIEPVKSVEFIFIPVRIKNTGEIATGGV